MEELCSRLKTAAENDHLTASNKAPACITAKSVSLNSVSQDSSNDTEEYTSSSTPEEQAERCVGRSSVTCLYCNALDGSMVLINCLFICIVIEDHYL